MDTTADKAETIQKSVFIKDGELLDIDDISTAITLADMPREEFSKILNQSNDALAELDAISARAKGQEYLDDLEEIGEGTLDPSPGDTVLSFGAQLRDDKPAPSGDDRPGPSAPTGPPSMGFQPQSTFDAEEEDETPADRGGGGNGGGGGRGCVIATHAVNSGAFTKDTKREAVRWCVKNLHRTWWGEAIRRGYRYYGQKAIDEGNAKNHYQEFKDYVAFGTGKRRTLKTAWTFVYRTVQFFIKGLFNAKR